MAIEAVARVVKERRQPHLRPKPEDGAFYVAAVQTQDCGDIPDGVSVTPQERIENPGGDGQYTNRMLESGVVGAHVCLKRQANLMNVSQSLQYRRVHQR
jgi:hypothetical protein